MRLGEDIVNAAKEAIKKEIGKDLNDLTRDKSKGSETEEKKKEDEKKEKPDQGYSRVGSEKRRGRSVENWEQWEQAIIETAYTSAQKIETLSLRLGDEILKKHIRNLEPHIRNALFLLFENGESVPHAFTGYKRLLTGCRYKVRDCIDYFHKNNKVDTETDTFDGDPSILAHLLAGIGELENKLKEIAQVEGKTESKGLNLYSVPSELKKSILLQIEEGSDVLSVDIYRSDELGHNMAKVKTPENTYYFIYEYEDWRIFESKTKEEEKKEKEVEAFVHKRLFDAAEEISRILQSMPAEERTKIVNNSEELQFLEKNNWDFTKWTEKILSDCEEKRNERVRRDGYCFDNTLAQAAEAMFYYKRELDKYLYNLEFNSNWNVKDQDRIEENKEKDEMSIYNKEGQLVYKKHRNSWEYGEWPENMSGDDTNEFGYAYDASGNIIEVHYKHDYYSASEEYNPEYGTNFKKAKISYENGKVSHIHVGRKQVNTNQQNGFAARHYSEKDVGHKFEDLFETVGFESSEDIYISYDTSGKVTKIENKGVKKTKYFDGDLEEKIEEVIFDRAKNGDKSDEEIKKIIDDFAMLKNESNDF